MDYTTSLDNVKHQSTSQRMHQDTGALPTVWSAKDANSIIWSLMEVIKAAGIEPKEFNADVPSSYKVLLDAIKGIASKGDTRNEGDKSEYFATTEFVGNAVKNVVGIPITFSTWGSRANIYNGFVADDGQILNTSLFPDFVNNYIKTNKVPVVSWQDWIDDPTKRASFALSSDGTQFRMRDLNGKSSGSLGAVVLRGDGLKSALTDGIIQKDAIRNIKGTFVSNINVVDANASAGVFKWTANGTSSHSSGSEYGKVISLDLENAGLPVTDPVTGENRVLNATGCYMTCLFSGTVGDPSLIDLQALVTQINAVSVVANNVDARVNKVILYPNGGTEAAPATVALNSKYYMDNPFGSDIVFVRAELYLTAAQADSGKDGWYESGYWADSSSNTYSYRYTKATQQGDKIRLKTGANSIIANTASNGPVTTDTSALFPCRIIVWRI